MTFPRSLLFVPANRTAMFARAWESDAEAVIVDLEDSVIPAQKAAAREALLALRPPEGWTRPVYVRSNSYGTPDFELDVRAATTTVFPLAGVILPKVEHAAQVRNVDAVIAARERHGQSLALVLLIETPAGVMRAAELADCGVKRVVALAFGSEDYRAGMGVDALDPALADFARATVSNAAAAAGVRAIDSAMLQLDDSEALRSAARRAKALGFHAKFAIHPSQIAEIHEAFDRDADRAWALRAVEAYERAARDGHGSAKLDGRMIDEATMKRARGILEA